MKATLLEEMLLDMEGYNNGGLEVSDERGIVAKDGVPTVGNRPLFKIAPTSDLPYVQNGESNPADIVVGLHGSNSTGKLQINGMRSRDSRESLIPEESKETWYAIAAQVSIPLLIAGLGMVGAGLILDIVKVLLIRISLSDKSNFISFPLFFHSGLGSLSKCS